MEYKNMYYIYTKIKIIYKLYKCIVRTSSCLFPLQCLLHLSGPPSFSNQIFLEDHAVPGLSDFKRVVDIRPTHRPTD